MGLHWDFVTILSIAMVVFSIVIFVYLVFKVRSLMKRDAASHQDADSQKKEAQQ